MLRNLVLSTRAMSDAALRGTPHDQEKMFADQHRFASLVEDPGCLDYDSIVWSFGIVPFLLDRDVDMQGITDEYGAHKTQSVVSVGHRVGIDDPRGHSDPDAEDEGAVCDTSAKGLGAAPFFVHVVGIEVARVAGVQNNVGFCDRAAAGHPLGADLIIFKIQCRHRDPPAWYKKQREGIAATPGLFLPNTKTHSTSSKCCRCIQIQLSSQT